MSIFDSSAAPRCGFCGGAAFVSDRRCTAAQEIPERLQIKRGVIEPGSSLADDYDVCTCSPGQPDPACEPCGLERRIAAWRAAGREVAL